jgi:hypothetical protein
MEVMNEPETHTLLLHEFTKAECRAIFPKRLPPAYAEAYHNLVQARLRVTNPACTIPPGERAAYLQQFKDRLPVVHKEDMVGLRIDLSLKDASNGETKWLDVTSVNAAAESYLNEEHTYLTDRKQSLELLRESKLPTLPTRPSPALVRREKLKVSKYARLVDLARKQYEEGTRESAPHFLPIAVSTTGDLGPETMTLTQWMAQRYRAKLSVDGQRADGVTTRELMDDYKHRLMVGMMFAQAAGQGEMIAHAGRSVVLNSLGAVAG